MVIIKTQMQHLPESCSRCDYFVLGTNKQYGAPTCSASKTRRGVDKIINVDVHREMPKWCPLKSENDTHAERHYCEECFYAEWFECDFYNCKYRAAREKGTSLVNEDDCCVYYASRARMKEMWEYCLAHWHPSVVAYENIGKTWSDLKYPDIIEHYYNETLKIEKMQAEAEE